MTVRVARAGQENGLREEEHRRGHFPEGFVGQRSDRKAAVCKVAEVGPSGLGEARSVFEVTDAGTPPGCW